MVGDTFYFFNYATSELLSFAVTDPSLIVNAVVAVGSPLNIGLLSGGVSLWNLCNPSGSSSSFTGMQLYISRTRVANQTGGLNPVDGSIFTTPFTLTTNGLPTGQYFGNCNGTSPICYYPWSMASACFPAAFPPTTTVTTTTVTTTTTTTAAPTTTTVAAPGLVHADAKSPRVGLYFHNSVAATLTGVTYYSVSGSQAVVVEAFNSSKSLVASKTLPTGSGISYGYASVFFTTPVAIAAASTYYVSFSALDRVQTYYVYNTPQVVGSATYVNSWYQYPVFSNPVVPLTYLNSSYYVYPILQ